MKTSAETASSDEIRPEILQKLEIAERIIYGEHGIDFDSEFADSVTTFGRPIYDENDTTLADTEQSFLKSWIERKLGCRLEEAPIRAKYKSCDRVTSVIVYDVELGDEWYLSRWQDDGKKPTYFFWHQRIYDWQLDEGYRKCK